MEKKVELLAPAGNYACFLGALHAGADAVYLGGTRFGARAFAGNFTEEEIISAVRYAHLFGRKVYLTVNTLTKQRELETLPDFVRPLYEAGLDGVIIQDFGVFSCLKREFPGLELHGSTQMAITGSYGARMLKEMGASRIVLARELSLAEIRQIKKEADMEIETFVHGAMCYCYSGRCLFSSMLGGRSGNRGRCAQPCRLPYQMVVDEKKVFASGQYPLSLKDLCTVQLIPELIEAGIDCFKIEGRMKRPEYVAGVTAIYRRYIDSFYEGGRDSYCVEEADLREIAGQYIRADIQDGYYFRRNGREMITLEKPGYSGSDEAMLEDIRKRWLENTMVLPVKGFAKFMKGYPSELTVTCEDIYATSQGSVPQAALRQPLTKEVIEKQLTRLGNTVFSWEALQIEMEEQLFLPVRELNELRRNALEKLEEQMIALRTQNRSKAAEQMPEQKQEQTKEQIPEQSQKQSQKQSQEQSQEQRPDENPAGRIGERRLAELSEETTPWLHILANTCHQARCAIGNTSVRRLYLEAGRLLLKEDGGNVREEMLTALADRKRREPGFEAFLALPYIVRNDTEGFLETALTMLKKHCLDGCLIRNVDTLQWMKERGYDGKIALDHNFHIWNRSAWQTFADRLDTYCAPLELHRSEIEALPEEGREILLYGSIPLMVTANCIRKTSGNCGISGGKTSDRAGMNRILTENEIIDRYRKSFQVVADCFHCYNVIYNTVPLSLHGDCAGMAARGMQNFRLDFLKEDAVETEQIITFFSKVLKGGAGARPPYRDYTTGHYRKSVE